MKIIKYLLISLIAIILFAMIYGLGGNQPENVGLNNSSLSPCNPDKQNCISSNATTTYHSMSAWNTNDTSNDISKLKEIISKDERAKIMIETQNYIYAQYTSKFFRFIDDVEFLLDTNGLIQFRSSSRLGRKDFGINRQRLEEIHKVLKD